MATFKSGVGGNVKVNLTTLLINTWTFEETETSAETTNSGSAGYQESIFVDRVATGTVEANWDADAQPRLDPPLIKSGTVIDSLKLYVSDTGKFFDLVARVTGCSVSNDVKGKVTYSFTYTTTGSWTEPT